MRACRRFPVDSVDGVAMCRVHAEEARYQAREFARMMATATRHSRQVGYGVPGTPGAGCRCLCGAFVLDTEDHPWGVPAVEEDSAM